MKYIWQYDLNTRIYRDDEGNKQSSPNYRKSWVKHEVVDETARSWVLSNGFKVPKKASDEYTYRNYAFSEEEVDKKVYLHDHAHKIADLVRHTDDYRALIEIADLMGYTETK